MNAAAPRGLDWRAVGIGAAVAIGGGLLLGVLMRTITFEGGPGLDLFWLLSYGGGMLVDLAGGATAGTLARRSGAAHGFLAGLVAAVVSPLVGIAMFLLASGERAAFDFGAWLVAVATSAVLGLVCATVAGAIAAPIAASRAR